MDAPALAALPLETIAARVGSSEPAPGAGPCAAWTCALAASLAEMVSAVALRHEPLDEEAQSRHRRAGELRQAALELADRDVAAYTEVMAVLRRRGEPGHGPRLREALSRAADPPAAIVELAAEVTRLAADAGAAARGGVRGEAVTAAVLAESAVRAARHIVEFNLAGARADPRLDRVRTLAGAAAEDLERAEHAFSPRAS